MRARPRSSRHAPPKPRSHTSTPLNTSLVQRVGCVRVCPARAGVRLLDRVARRCGDLYRHRRRAGQGGGLHHPARLWRWIVRQHCGVRRGGLWCVATGPLAWAGRPALVATRVHTKGHHHALPAFCLFTGLHAYPLDRPRVAGSEAPRPPHCLTRRALFSTPEPPAPVAPPGQGPARPLSSVVL